MPPDEARRRGFELCLAVVIRTSATVVADVCEEHFLGLGKVYLAERERDAPNHERVAALRTMHVKASPVVAHRRVVYVRGEEIEM